MSKEPFANLPDVLNAKQLAEALHLSKAGAYNLLNADDFPTLKIGGRKLVIKQDLLLWLKKHTNSQEQRKTPEKCPYCVTGAQKGVKMRTGLTKRQKTTEIFFDETKSRITVYTHNTDLKKRLTAYAERYPDHCTMTDEDSETGYKAFEIEKGRLSFRLTAPYSEERRRAASDYAKKVTNFMQQGD